MSVPSGQYACITGEMSDGAIVSYQEGSVGASAGGWAPLAGDETAFNQDFVVVATAVDDGENFSLAVRDVHEEPDCEDEDEEEQEEPPPPAEPCECDPSDYFLVWQDIPAILQELLSPPTG